MNYLKSFLLLTTLVSIISCTSSEKLTKEAKAGKNETKTTKKSVKKDASIDTKTLIHYSETYGSSCCPRDPKYNFHISKYIAGFEAKNKVQIDTYYITRGKEGEATYYINLDNLNKKQQYQFIMERAKVGYDAADKILKAAYPLYKQVPEGFKIQKL